MSERDSKSITQPTPRARKMTTILHRVEIVLEKHLMESSMGKTKAKKRINTPVTISANVGVTIFNTPYSLCYKNGDV